MNRFCFSIFSFERAMKSLAVARDKFNVNCFIECLVVRVMFSTGLNGLKFRWWFFGDWLQGMKSL